MSSYRGYPVTIGEFRANRSSDAADWSPREALISILRDIDSGRLSPTNLVICFSTKKDKDRYVSASKTRKDALVTIEAAKLSMMGY